MATATSRPARSRRSSPRWRCSRPRRRDRKRRMRRAGWDLRHVEHPDPDWYRDLYKRVGEPWLWFSRLVMPTSGAGGDHRRSARRSLRALERRSRGGAARTGFPRRRRVRAVVLRRDRPPDRHRRRPPADEPRHRARVVASVAQDPKASGSTPAPSITRRARLLPPLRLRRLPPPDRDRRRSATDGASDQAPPRPHVPIIPK